MDATVTVLPMARVSTGSMQKEGIGLKLGQGDVLGREGAGAAELVGNLPGEALQDAVAQEAQRKATDVVDLALGGL